MINQGSVVRWQKILVELMAVWIVMVASSIFSRTEPNIIGFFIWLAIALGIYTMVRYYFKHQLKYIYLLFLFIPFVLIGINLGFTPIQSATLSGIITWRMVIHEKDPERETESIVLGLSVLVVLITYLTAYYGELENSEQIIWMLLIQIFFLVTGRLFHNLSSMKSKHTIKKSGMTMVSVLALTFGTASLLYVLFPLIRKAFYLIINGVISIFAVILKPFFSWVETIEPEPKEGEVEDHNWEDRGNEKQKFEELTSEPLITSEHLLIGFIILVAVIILVILFKNKEQLLSKINLTNKNDDLVSDSSAVNERKLWRKNTRNIAPNNDIRKAFFKLEKWASKQELGRYGDETIEEWLNRYEFTNVIDDQVINIYRDVRYGDKEIEADQKGHYFNQINQLKKAMKEQYIDDDHKDTYKY